MAGLHGKFNGYPAGLPAAQLPGALAERKRDQKMSEVENFLETFGKPPRLLTCECERSGDTTMGQAFQMRSEEHTSELQSQSNLVCRLLLEKKKLAQRTAMQEQDSSATTSA